MEFGNRCGPAVLRLRNSLVDLLDTGDREEQEREKENEEGLVLL